jgi:hypothetical protein
MAKKTQTQLQLPESTLVQRNIAIFCIVMIGAPIFLSFILNRYSLFFYAVPVLAILGIVVLLIKKTRVTILIAMILAIIVGTISFPFVLLPLVPWHF